MSYRRDVPGRPGDLTAPGDVEELAEMIGNEGSELAFCRVMASYVGCEIELPGQAHMA